MKAICDTPPCREECITGEDILNLRADNFKLQELLTLVLANQKANIDSDILRTYHQLIQSNVTLVDEATAASARTANQNSQIFLNNYSLLSRIEQILQQQLRQLQVVAGLKYQVRNIDANYTIKAEDMTGNWVLRIVSPIQVTLARLDNSLIGSVIHLRNAQDSLLRLAVDNGAIFPSDGAYLRREGSMMSFLYLGEGNWDAIGELP